MEMTRVASATSIIKAGSVQDRSQVIAQSLNLLLADVFALYLKTKSFHWHVSGPNFRDYHLLLDEQASEIFAMTDVLAERVRKLGAMTLRSIGDIHRAQRIDDCEPGYWEPMAMLGVLLADNRRLVREMQDAHEICSQQGDVATTSILETFIDEGERRAWFLREICVDVPFAL